MDKISGILPSSARVSSVDMKEANPVRPGTPSFGRPEGVSSLRDAKIGQTASRAAKISQDRLDWRSKDMQNAAMANELSSRFFQGNKKVGAEKVVDIDAPNYNLDMDRKSTPAGFKTDELDRVTGSGAFAGDAMEAVSGREEAAITLPDFSAKEAETTSQPDGLYPRGSFIDFRA